jgi:DNA-binding response OmpR family regulator
MRLLVVEDDPELGSQLVERLTSEGYAVDLATDGEEAGFLGETEPFDAVVLDLGLPKVDGLTVLRGWRRAGVATPVIILTARGRLIPLSQVHHLLTDRPSLRCVRRPDEIRWLSCDGVAVA